MVLADKLQTTEEVYFMQRVLVTGGAGFLGSHLCDKLIATGYEVLCVDNLFTGSKENIRHLLAHPHFEFMRHDIMEPLFVEVDQIYNLACPASPPHTIAAPLIIVPSPIIAKPPLGSFFTPAGRNAKTTSGVILSHRPL